jgi:hypothetical protein
LTSSVSPSQNDLLMLIEAPKTGPE